MLGLDQNKIRHFRETKIRHCDQTRIRHFAKSKSDTLEGTRQPPPKVSDPRSDWTLCRCLISNHCRVPQNTVNETVPRHGAKCRIRGRIRHFELLFTNLQEVSDAQR